MRGEIELIGMSPQVRELARRVDATARAQRRVLISGEHGTGTASVARLIHERSSRHSHPFIVVRCGGVSDATLESELFEHTLREFDATDRNTSEGIEHGQRGTVLLADVGEMSLHTQGMLVRCLRGPYEGTYPPIRSQGNIWIIAATHDDLVQAVEHGNFLEDLYYQLAHYRITVPSLRHRAEDILALTDSLVLQEAARLGVEPPRLTPSARTALQTYDWPGNTRELMNVLEGLVKQFGGREVEAWHVAAITKGGRARAVDVPCGQIASTLLSEMTQRGGSFWDVVYEPFIAGEISRFDVWDVLCQGLFEAGGNISRLVELWNMRVRDIRFFGRFLRNFRAYRPSSQPYRPSPEERAGVDTSYIAGQTVCLQRPPKRSARKDPTAPLDPMLVRATSFPAGGPVPVFVNAVIDVFRNLPSAIKTEDVPEDGVLSEDVLDLVRPELLRLGFASEGRLNCRVEVPLPEGCVDDEDDGDTYVVIHFIDAYHQGWGCGLDVVDINEGHWVTPYSVIAYEQEVLELDHLIIVLPDRSPTGKSPSPTPPTTSDFALLCNELGLIGDELPFGITAVGLTFMAR